MTVEALLASAEAMLAGKSNLRQTSIERAAALLARQALEMRVAERLSPHGLDPATASFTAQLLCVQGTMSDKSIPRRAANLWASLSSMVHHVGYEISPNGEDIAGLVRRTIRVVEELSPNASKCDG